MSFRANLSLRSLLPISPKGEAQATITMNRVVRREGTLNVKFAPKLIPKSLMTALRDPQRKALARFWLELVAFSVRKKEQPIRYIHGFLYRGNIPNPYDYLSVREGIKLRVLATRPDLVSILDNKLSFYNYFDKLGITLPGYIGHTEGNYYYSRSGEIMEIVVDEDLKRIASQIFSEGRTSFFAKPIINYGGKNIFKITPDSALDGFCGVIRCNNYLLQESVEQHSALAAIYPSSLNTMRIITCINRSDGKAKIACARFRFGRGGKYVDNITAGGLHAGVNLEKGIIATHCMENIHFGGRVYERHPDTGGKFRGLEIPFFKECLETIESAANHLGYPLVGWDLAIGKNGPVLVEGNSSPNHHGSEIASGPYMTNPILRSFINELTGGKGL